MTFQSSGRKSIYPQLPAKKVAKIKYNRKMKIIQYRKQFVTMRY